MRTRAIALISSLFIAAGISLSAQSGANHVTGQDEAGYESLSSKVLKLEKKSDAFNFYLNFAAAAGLSDSEGKWQGSMYSKHLRMEILGDLTPRIYYRFRHHLDMAALKASLDNFALATDMMYVGYRASGKLDAIVGKMPTAVGGFEFDEMPVYIYRFSDFTGRQDCFQVAAQLSYRPVPDHEFTFQIASTANRRFADQWGSPSYVATTSLDDRAELQKAAFPFMYSAAWSGNLFGGMLQTRWSLSYQNHLKDNGGYILALGQKLNLDRLSWYVDLYGEWDGADRLGMISTDFFSSGEKVYAGETSNVSLVTKLNYRFAPKWNLMAKVSFEKAGLRKIEELRGYRTSSVYVSAIEYYPDRTQDLRFFLAYLGRHCSYNEASGIPNVTTNTMELGLIYRIKAY